jgi:hypothetical protein
MKIGTQTRPLQPGAAVRGWRAWTVTETAQGLRLGSVLFEQVWLPGEPASAACKRDEDPFAAKVGPHEVGSSACSCGFYAARDPAEALSYLYGRDEPSTVCRILGEVALWGGVLEGDAGWRATHAYPVHLYLAEASLAEALAVYGVAISSATCESRSSRTCTGTRSRSGPRWQISRPNGRT